MNTKVSILITTITAMLFASATITAQNTLTSDESVVINGIKWATRNVDAPGTFTANPEDFGMFYQWNSNIGWSATNPLTPSDGVSTWNPDWNKRNPDGSINKSQRWHTTNNICPTGWRIPSKQELEKLVAASSVWTTLNGVNGRLFGSGDNTIFLPAAGGRWYSDSSLPEKDGALLRKGRYWSRTPNIEFDNHSYALFFYYSYALIFGNTGILSFSGIDKHPMGYCIRCVAE